jgi:hypothetical protein
VLADQLGVELAAQLGLTEVEPKARPRGQGSGGRTQGRQPGPPRRRPE